VIQVPQHQLQPAIHPGFIEDYLQFVLYGILGYPNLLGNYPDL
jgi:hypothetical protein